MLHVNQPWVSDDGDNVALLIRTKAYIPFEISVITQTKKQSSGRGGLWRNCGTAHYYERNLSKTHNL